MRTMALKPRWGKAALATTAALLTLAILALVGEAAVRYRERHRSKLAGTMPLLFYQHGRLGHALVRDFDYFGWIHIDRQGFRGPEVALQRAPGAVRIMAVGSSTTFDPAVSGDAATWPARLQFWLNQLSPGSSVEVINAGVPGYRMIDDLIRLDTELYRYQPDVIVLYEGHNDLFGAFRTGRDHPGLQTSTPGEVPAITPWGHWLTRHSLLFGKTVARLKSLQLQAAAQQARTKAEAAEPSYDDIINTGAQEFERDAACFLALAHSLGARVVIPEMVHASGVGTVSAGGDSTLFQEWARTFPFGTPEAVLRGYVRYNAVLERVAERFAATWVPTGSFGLAGTQWYGEGDPVHFNDRGADRMARQLAEALLASGVLDFRAPKPRANLGAGAGNEERSLVP